MRKIKLSKEIESFLNACEECKRQYRFNYDIVGKCDGRTTDFLHSIELTATTAKERSKLATAQRKNLLERREAKNIVEECEPLIEWLTRGETVRSIELLKQVLGATRKVEAYHANRSYKKRSK